MSRTVFRYVATTYLKFAAGIFLAVLAIYLVADYVDRSRLYSGPNSLWIVLELYGYKALVFTRQLAPAALLLGAGAAVSALRRTGEITAMRSVALGPAALYVPVLACALVVSLGMIFFDDAFAAPAGRQIDEITLRRFGGWGDWRFYNTPKQWFRTPQWIVHLRGGSPADGYDDVTLLQLTPSFRLLKRVDAPKMRPVGGKVWLLEGATVRTFDAQGALTGVRELEQTEVDLGVDRDAFVIRQGRPEQLRFSQLREQISNRETVGLPSKQWALALHDRVSYPLAGIPAALLAVGLALRPQRRGNLTTALVEGLVVAMFLWGLMVVAKTLVLGNRLPPAVAAWAPFALLLVAAAALWARREGKLGWRGS